MLDIDRALEAVAKLRRIEPSSELEKAVIDNIINSHIIAIHKAKADECKNKIMNYSASEYHNMLDYLEQKLGEM